MEFGNDQVIVSEAEHFAQSPHDARVGRDAALEHHRLLDLAPPCEVAPEVPGNCKAKSRNDVFHGRSNLLQVNHVTLGKDTAPSRNVGRLDALHGELAELALDRDSDPFRLLIQKAAGPGRTHRVHREVRETRRLVIVAGPDHDQLGVLAAYLDHRPCLGMQRRHGGGLGHYLVHKGAADQVHGYRAAGSGDRNRLDAFRGVARENVVQDLEQSVKRATVAERVVVFHDITVAVDQRRIDRNRTDVES